MKKLFLSVFAAALCAGSILAATRSPKQEISRNLDIFNSIYKTLQTTYVDSIDAERSINKAITAMLNDIDPYTEYIPEKDQEDFLTISTGEFGGIGAYIRQDKSGRTIVAEPQAGTPAYRAGLKAGDIFLTVNGDTVTTIGSDSVRNRLRGQAGTDLRVSVIRPYAKGDSILYFDITREKIEVNPVPYYGVVRDSVGYIMLTTFNEKSPEAVRNALIELKKDPRVKGIALDLRGNGGGLLESAVKIVGLFVPKGTEVLQTRGKGLLDNKTYKTTSAPVDTKIPLAVIIDGGTASSSEITAGALQDLDRAVILGNRSFGKGLVQSTRPIPYNGLLKVTIAKYYIPSGRLIQAIDYAHRNSDGSAKHIPDSLTNVFYTAGGREVRDGGGIMPDITIEYPEANRLTYNVVRDQWDFDFATRYAAEHDSVAAPEVFVVDDAIYEEFKAFIDPEKFNNDKIFDEMVDTVEKAAETEGYLDDNVKDLLSQLKVAFHHDLMSDLDANRSRIADYLANELLTRYYTSSGAMIYQLRFDPALERAAQILSNPKEYKSILSPKSK